MPAASAKRVRLDQLLVERGLASTRSRAQALVLAGQVRVGAGDAARRDLKAGDLVDRAADVAVAEGRLWVSRGAHKLLAALDAFGMDPAGLVAADVGASTGGFTDVLLARGAARVYAVDVGYGQLADKLRRDARVVSMERVNARTLGPGSLPEPVDLAVVDVAFISLALVLGPVRSVLRDGRGPIVALVKPQFEAGRSDARGGVVRDRDVHLRVLRETAASARALGLGTRDVIASPILGPEGNREFLAWFGAGPTCAELDDRIEAAVAAAWEWHLTVGRIGFAYNPTIEDAVELSERATGWCQMHGIAHWVSPSGETPALVERLRDTDVLVVLGGDGTFLRAAQAVAEVDVPILGINLGKIGFLSKAEGHELEDVLGKLQGGQYSIRDRMGLTGAILPAGRPGGTTFTALNDIVVARGSLARVVRLDVTIDESHLATFVADGLVVASPTGSTGYSFSAGGPILDPNSRNLVVTPIAGYLSAIRSIVVSPRQVVRARVLDAHEALVSIDGREDHRIAVGDVVEVRALERPIRFVEPDGSTPFWDLLRTKVQLLPS